MAFMDIRKIVLMLGALLSGICQFIPLYTLTVTGFIYQKDTVTLFPSILSFVILGADIMIIIGTFISNKKIYIICSIISIISTISALIRVQLSKGSSASMGAITNSYMSGIVGTTMYQIEDGPAMVLLIIAIIVIAAGMVWNAVNDD
jgi:hypothetical protein